MRVMTCSRCDKPITASPVYDPGDPLNRSWCTDECLTAAAEEWAEGYYGYGVAT